MESPIILQTNRLKLYYGAFEALKGIDMQIPEKQITAFIGPSGCGKSTFLKTLNRMNDLVPGVRIEGEVLYNGRDIFSKEVDVTWLRKKIGMVFQKPNPFNGITFFPQEPPYLLTFPIYWEIKLYRLQRLL